MATQEPNVYAGLVGRHRRAHARPPALLRQGHGRAAVLGRRGQDAVRLATTRIWEPKWQVEGLVDWRLPGRDVLRLPARSRPTSKKKILGLNAAKLYGVEVPQEFQLPDDAGTPAARDDAELVEGSA